jgi:hypothetical protein
MAAPSVESVTGLEAVDGIVVGLRLAFGLELGVIGRLSCLVGKRIDEVSNWLDRLVDGGDEEEKGVETT